MMCLYPKVLSSWRYPLRISYFINFSLNLQHTVEQYKQSIEHLLVISNVILVIFLSSFM
jgi:hypothetical protein